MRKDAMMGRIHEWVMGDCNVLLLVWEFAHMGVYSLETVIELYTYGFCIMFQ